MAKDDWTATTAISVAKNWSQLKIQSLKSTRLKDWILVHNADMISAIITKNFAPVAVSLFTGHVDRRN
jgi:hypothetical protein